VLETSARLLRLLALFQHRRYWSGADLAKRLEVASRTLRRDVDKLRSLGYPIHSASGVEGGYQLGAGSEMPPLLLDDEEAVAVALGLRATATGAVAGVEDASLRALAKMEQILPRRLRRRVEDVHAMVVSAPARSPAVDARVLSAIAGACRDRESLRFGYESHGGESSQREVEPYRVVHLGMRWYLVAWDSHRKAWRTFRVDRIRSRPVSGARFPPREPPAEDLAAYVRRGVWLAPPCRARVKLLVDAATATARVPVGLGMIEPVDKFSCMLEVGSSSYEGLAMGLVWLGVDFRVTGPPELVAEVRRIAERYASAAES
jgi:predicted DNA-binding transcriptional regulator YafY